MMNTELIIQNNFYKFSRKASAIKGDLHYHNDYEIYYLVDGFCRYFVNNNSYIVSSGDVIIIPPKVIHNTVYDKSKRSRILISCPKSYIPDSVITKIYENPCFRKSPDTESKVKEIFKCIENETLIDDAFSQDAIRNKIGELLLLLARNCNTGSEVAAKSTLIEQAIDYIKHNYSLNNITLSQTAEHCFVSKEHLSRTFKKETGCGFRKFLNIYRLKKAEAMLKAHPEYKIVDVALRCGFNDSNYFSKVYKQLYKKSPTQSKMKGE